MNRNDSNGAGEGGVVFRLATEADADVLAELRREFLAEVNGPLIAPPGLEDALHSYFRTTIPTGQFLAHVAESGGRIIATSGLVFYHCPPSYSNPSGREAYVMNMYTRPEWRGRGIGRRLLDRVLESARQAGCDRVTLHAEPKARPLYERVGFRPSEQEMRKPIER